MAARVPEPAVHTRLDVDRALLDYDDSRLRAVERCLLTTAQAPTCPTRARRRTLPGSGAILRVGRLDAIQDIPRFPRGHAFVSSGRFGPCARASAGTHEGTAGTTMGTAVLPWAVSAAAVRGWRAKPAGQTDLARVETHPRHGKAFTIRAHP